MWNKILYMWNKILDSMNETNLHTIFFSTEYISQN